MKRSMAPSQRRLQKAGGCPPGSGASAAERAGDSETIQTMPLFGFLSIPDSMKRQFKVPSGCRITEQSIALRKIKTLGGRKSFQPLRPQGVAQFKRLSPVLTTTEEEEQLDGATGASDMPAFDRLVLWEASDESGHKIEVIPDLASKLRPHQREGVQFLFECTMGLRGFEGQGCILADDMGLGKTLMSITLLWTLLNQGFTATASAVRKAVVVCPTSLVGNWENELRKWVGPHCPTFAVKSEPKKCIRNFIQHRGKGILIVSYETQRRYTKMFTAGGATHLGQPSTCDLLICDEAHKLKNANSGLAVSLNTLPAKKRILLSGTPMQNELSEFFNMVNFCNPGVLGTNSEFRRRYERPILQSRERGASEREVAQANTLQKELSTIVNEFILKRGNILNARHLPPKLVQYVCCELTPLQDAMYDKLLSSKECRHILDGRNSNALNTIRYMINICSHPDMIVSAHKAKVKARETDSTLAELAEVVEQYKGGGAVTGAPPGSGGLEPEPSRADRCSARGVNRFPIHKSASSRPKFRPELSGKFFVLYRLMETLRAMRQGDRIVIVSNFTSTLDLVEAMCADNGWPQLRLDGTTLSAKRTKLVDAFNDPTSGAFAFLLSSKAGGCGINLIGGNRLVLFDPDWNPASDKQAAARIWREGQTKRCFIYRFMSTSSIEEKIIQRQLSKEGLTSIVDNKEQVNSFSSRELKALFRRPRGTRSDTHDTLRCSRCKGVAVVQGEGEGGIFEPVVQRCLAFLDEFRTHVEAEAARVEVAAVDFADLFSIKSELLEGAFPALPAFSRKLRNVVRGIGEIERDKGLPFDLYEEFLTRWTELVPELSALSSGAQYNDDDADCDGGGEDCVEQDGCPEEEDFNRWSHHNSVRTCDDEALKRAMGDDTSVSFVFGLEVNWDLLQARMVEREAEEEAHKEQLRKDLEELNARRRRDKAILAGGAVSPERRGGSRDSSGEENSLASFIADPESDDDEMQFEDDFVQPVTVAGKEKQTPDPLPPRSRVLCNSDSDDEDSSLSSPVESCTAEANMSCGDEERRRKKSRTDSRPLTVNVVAPDHRRGSLPLADVSNHPVAPTVADAPTPAPPKKTPTPTSDISRENKGEQQRAMSVETVLSEWDCPMCTYLNSKRASKCLMCGTRKIHQQ